MGALIKQEQHAMEAFADRDHEELCIRLDMIL